MSAQHTPGPWFATKVSDYNKIACIGRAWNISTILPLADFGDVDADARLITAAPDLLAALQALVAELDGPGKPYSSDSYAPPHFIETARAAIAKATNRRATFFGGAEHGETK